MDVKQVLIDLKINTEEEKNTRCDPTSLLPEEPMTYAIKEKKKKKKKKKKEKQEDPFKDIQEKALVTERIMMADEEAEAESNPEVTTENLEPEDTKNFDQHVTIKDLDPEVNIKAEKIEEDFNYDDFADNTDLMDGALENNEEPEVKIEPEIHNADVTIKYETTFEDIRDKEKLAVDGVLEAFDANITLGEQEVSYRCQVCHLLFKTPKTLAMHQNRKHKAFRRNNKHICNDCGMSYQFKSSLIAHVKRKHGPEASRNDNENRSCEICGWVFVGMNRLRMHMRRKHDCYEESFEHICSKCGLTYDKAGSLLVHMRRKHPKTKKPVVNQVFKCPFCPKIYNNRETYARHMERHHKVNEDGKVDSKDDNILASFRNEAGEIACKECSLVFTKVSFLKLHMRRRHNAFKEEFKIKCGFCNLSYAKHDSLKEHIRRKHSTRTDCNVCGKHFDTPAAYMSHSHERHVKECPLCGQPFASQGGLSKHLRCTHKIESPKVVFCDICREGFHDKRLLKPHMMKVHFNVSYKCGSCQKVFKTKETLRRHITKIHPVKSSAGNESQKCEKCSQSFSDEFLLCQHINLVHLDPSSEYAKLALVKKEDNPEPFHCTKCTATYGAWDQLRVHFQQTHCVEKTVQCQVCGQMLMESKLHKHMRVAHTVTDEVKCKYCDFKSNVRASMTQHMLRHKNATTINCDYPNCRYKTYYEHAIKKHKQKHEKIGAKFQCSKCAFQSMDKYLLKYHEDAHETGKKYACDQCDYSAAVAANLVQHKYKHSTEKRFKCEVCPFATKFNTSLRFHVKTKHCDLPT